MIEFSGGTVGNIALRASAAIGTPLECYIVAQRVGAFVNAFSPLLGSGVSGQNPNPVGDWWYLGINPSILSMRQKRGSGAIEFANIDAAKPMTERFVLSGRLEAGAILVRKGDTSQSSPVAGGVTPSGGYQVGGNVVTWHIRDVLIFDRDLNSEERSTLVAYLEAKHAIS